MREYPPEWDEEWCDECGDWAEDCPCESDEPDYEAIRDERDAEAARMRDLETSGPTWEPGR